MQPPLLAMCVPTMHTFKNTYNKNDEAATMHSKLPPLLYLVQRPPAQQLGDFSHAQDNACWLTYAFAKKPLAICLKMA
jgi:hypothetical protein